MGGGGGIGYGEGRAMPYTGKIPGGWQWGYSHPEGYRTNHKFHGLSGFFRMFFFSQWGSTYYLKRMAIVSAKIGFGFLLCYYPFDPLMANFRALKRKQAMKQGGASA